MTENELRRKMSHLGVRQEDIIERFVRAQGPGGQNVNKVSTCVYLRHIPTGIEVKCQQQRTQAQNRLIGRQILLEKIEARAKKRLSEEVKRKEKLRRQKRGRSRMAKLKILEAKRHHSLKKSLRARVRQLDVIILSLFFGVMLFSGQAHGDQQTIRIAASNYPMYIMAKNVARDVPDVEVFELSRSTGGCLHDYALDPGDMKRLEGAQVLVANGAGLENFLERVAAQYSGLKIIRLSDGVPLIKGKGNAGDNPHVWVSISGAITEVKNLEKGLEEFDPARRELYKANAAAYVARLEALRQRMHSELAGFSGRQMITFHEAFPYFAQEFNLKIAGVVEREPGAQPSARELADTIGIIRENGIKVIFSEPQYPSAAAQTIAVETGAKVYVLDPAVTGPDDYDAYINIMEKNLEVLKKAFSAAS